MPTSLPERRRRADSHPSFVLFFILAFFAACFAIEIVDPAPMELAAAWIASP